MSEPTLPALSVSSALPSSSGPNSNNTSSENTPDGSQLAVSDQQSTASAGEVRQVADSMEEGATAPLDDEQSGQATATSALMENVKLRAVELKTENGAEEDLARDVYHLKWVKFKGRTVPLVTQNVNGPCPLLAIVNVLLLKEKITLNSSDEVITSNQLMGYLGDIVLQAMPHNLEQGEQANWEQNVNDAIAVFHKLQTGLDVNVRFTGVHDFEYTPECVVFDLLSIPLFHGWLVDTAMPETAEAVGNLTYNQLVEKIIENQGSIDESKSTPAVLGQMFLNDSASQLTYHGLSELAATMQDDQLAVFFRNNHFSTIYRHRGELFLLVTDQGYLRESRVVWETLCNVEGDGQLVDSEFHSAHKANQEPILPHEVPVNTQAQVDQDLLLALSLSQPEEPVQNKAMTSETDEQFALRLQEEEDRQVAVQQQQAERSASESVAANTGQRDPRAQRYPMVQRDNLPGSPIRQRARKNSGSCTLL